jgi:SPP1 gp7 family putative phage head morphogenesis protein
MPSSDKIPENPETANEAFLSALLRHQIYILRFSEKLRKKIEALLNAVEQDLEDKIFSRLRGTTGLSSPGQLKRMETLSRIVKNMRLKSWEQVNEVWLEELTALAKAEPATISSIVTTVSPVIVETVLPPPRLLETLVKSKPFQGRVMKDWIKTLRDEDIRRIESSIQIGMVQGESNNDIAKRIVGTAQLRGTEGVTEITRRQAAALTRTAVNFIGNEARSAFFKANEDIIEGEQFVATLDSRTTAVCRANDGKKFKIGEGPIPPLHFNCRSLRVPVLLGDALGDRPAKAVTNKQLLREFSAKNDINVKSRDDLPRGLKGEFDKFSRKRIRELTGQVPATTSYQTWLKSQSKEFQEDVLGKTKAKLFRDGKLQLDKFVTRNGTELTLSQLAKKHADAFRAAGLNPEDFI